MFVTKRERVAGGPVRSRVEDLKVNGRGGPFARGLSLYLRQAYHGKTGLI